MSSLSEFSPGPSSRTQSGRRNLSLVTQLARDMQARWARGERIRVEDYLASTPELQRDADAALGLIYEELCLCEGAGESVELADLVRRFPQWEHRLGRLLDCRNLLNLGPELPSFPEPGDTLGQFQLVTELGQGKHGKVFLATEPKLAHRALVLKVTAASGFEHLSLARLQHTYIVPLYFVEDEFVGDEIWGGLRVLGMPFFGGASLERFLSRIQDKPLALRTGKDIVDWLSDERDNIPETLDVSTDAHVRLATLPFARIVCWIGVCMAEAIQYAHEKGLVHLDIKPSNVLLTADGVPMLLDFHLAREAIRAGNPIPLWLGGTTRYMSPEQAAVFEAISTGGGISQDVDERSDIYSLGLLLYELLGGVSPLDGTASARISEIARLTSPGLADILAKCLSVDPALRYPTAGAVALDLERHLKNEPLEGVPNRSLAERWRKWRRRAPMALRNWSLLVGLLGTLALAASISWSHLREGRVQARAMLQEGRERLKDGHFALARRTLEQGLQIAISSSEDSRIVAQLRDELHRADGLELARTLHSLMDELRTLFGLDPLPVKKVLDVLPRCRAVWTHRKELLRRSDVSRVPQDRERLLNDLLELAILWSDLRMRTASAATHSTANAEVLTVLEEAGALAGVSAVVEFEQACLRGETARFDVDRVLRALKTDSPRAAWELYALGLALLNHDRLEDARRCLELAVQLQPNSLWTQFYFGRCQYQLKDYSDAARAFSACIALAPTHAGAWHNRALAFEEIADHERALRDYNQAIALDPNLTGAVLNRGSLQYRQQRYAEARTDLERALILGADPVVTNYNLALVAVALGRNADAALALNRVLQQAPDHAGAQELLKAAGRR